MNENSGFSFLTLFAVTGFSGFGFSLAVKVLDGYYPPVFLWMGVGGISLAVITLLIQPLLKKITAHGNKKKHNDAH